VARLVLMCGIAGSGKSTYARRLEVDGWVRFSIDAEAWERGLREVPLPEHAAAEIRADQRLRIEAALRAGQDVVVDYSFWSRAQRDDYRALGRACGAGVEVVHLDVPAAELRRRLALRRTAHPDDFVVPPEVLDQYVAGFQRPGPDEGDVTVLT
jgi:predicted kinase